MAKVPYSKPALTYADQLQQLKNRGLIVENDNKALHILKNVSYYRLSGYLYPMVDNPKSKHTFKPGSSFNNGFKLYCFDRELRKMVISELEKIEVAIRAIMIYNLSHHNGPFWYTNPTLFSDIHKHTETVNKIREEFLRTDEQFITVFRRKYNNPLPPSWIMLEITSFGSLSMLYKNLKDTHDKRSIAHHFGLDDTTFESWLHSIVYVRNVCAHHSRLWSRVMRITPSFPLSTVNPWISRTTTPHSISGNPPIKIQDRTYYILSIIVYLLNTVNPNNSFKLRLFDLLDRYKMIDVRAMGFPVGWEEEPLWNWKEVKGQKTWYKVLLKKFVGI